MQWDVEKKFETCFLKVELTLIWHGFLNMPLSYARREGNADRCHDRKCAKYVFCVNGLVPVLR